MRRISIIGLLIIFISLQCKLWFTEDGISGVIKIKKEVKKHETQLATLRARNITLLENIKNIKQNPNTIEEHARVTFGMIKKDETYYRLVD